jgi:cyclic pyranopterin phosphate synthase
MSNINTSAAHAEANPMMASGAMVAAPPGAARTLDTNSAGSNSAGSHSRSAGIAGIKDSYGRIHTYLRLSVTEACNYRCQYCGPAALHHGLSDDEIVQLCSLFREMGIQTLRITGGEPTIRPGLISLIARLASLGFARLALTTNGARLLPDAHTLKDAGITSINVHLDAVDDDLYAFLTGGFTVRPVLDGIVRARAEGIDIKLNSVLLANTYQQQVRQLMAFAKELQIPLRFIELMPFGDGARLAGVSTGALVRFLSEEYGEQVPSSISQKAQCAGSGAAAGPAVYRCFGGVEVGFISALTDCFCSRCQRLRLTSEGNLKACLYHPEFLDIKVLLDQGVSREELCQRIEQFVLTKRLRHEFQKAPVEWPLSFMGG